MARLKTSQTKSAGGDPLRPRRLRRCANQDHSRGRNYTSNQGGHATFNGCVCLDTSTSGTKLLVETVRDAYSQCGHAYITVVCVLPLAGFPEMATSTAEGASISRKCMCTTLGRFSRNGDFDRRRGLYIKAVKTQDARSIKFFQDLPLTVSQARWRDGNNFRGGATNRNLSQED